MSDHDDAVPLIGGYPPIAADNKANPTGDDAGTRASPAPGTPRTAEGITSVAGRILALLELLAHEDEAVGVREAARRTGIDRSAVSRLFSQLERLGAVEQLSHRGRFAPGKRLLSLAASLRARDTLWRAAGPILEALVAEFDESCYLTVREGDSVMFREKIDSSRPIRYVVELGRAFPLASGAAGQAILSVLPEEDVRRILDDGVPQFTEASILDRDRYLEVLAEHRSLGFACSIGRWVRNGAGVAAPFFDAHGNVAGSLTMSLPADRLEVRRVPEIGATMRRAADELSRRLGYTGV